MEREWQNVTIEEIASRIAMGPFGSDIKTDNFVLAGVPVIRGGNLTSGRFHGSDFVFLTEQKADELENANAFPGDLVFTHRGTLGQVGLIPAEPFKRYIVSQSQMKLTCNPELPGLPKPIADLFPGSFQQSRLGEIPKGWKDCTLEDLSMLNPATWQKQKRPATINYVDLSNTKWGVIEVVKSFAQQDAPSRAQRILQPGDTIVGTVRPGNGSYAFIFEEGLTGSTGFAVLHPLRVEYAELVYFAVTAAENIEALSHVADGGAYPAVRPEIVAATRVIKADDAIIKSFSHLTGPLLAKIAENESESRTLAALRDALLPKLISGELRVKDAERFIGNCA